MNIHLFFYGLLPTGHRAENQYILFLKIYLIICKHLKNEYLYTQSIAFSEKCKKILSVLQKNRKKRKFLEINWQMSSKPPYHDWAIYV